MSERRKYEWRKCRACNGTGRVVDGERATDAAFSFGASLILSAVMGEDVITRECGNCDGEGEIKRLVEASHD